MKYTKTGKDVMKVTLVCAVLISALLGSSLLRKGAGLPPIYFSIEATVCPDPHFGYYGGYHAIWDAIKPELREIGIDLIKEIQDDDLVWWDQVWEMGWNLTGDNTYPPGGWDVTMLEWWLQPHAVEPWFAAMVLSDQTPYEDGFNIHPWLNERADEYLLLGLQTYDAEARKYYLWKFQEEFMHDPPIAEIYYPRIYEIIASYLMGYDSSGSWWYDVKHLDINETKFEEVVGPLAPHPNNDRYAKGANKTYYAITEEWWYANPMYMETYTDEQVGCLVYDTLYSWSLDYTDEEWRTLAGVVEPDPEDYIILPELAAGPPEDVDHNGLRMRVPLREGVLWSDGEEFNATDVKYTFDMTFTPKAKCSGVGDFAYVIDHVEFVNLAQGAGGEWSNYAAAYVNASAVDFILKQPSPDLMSVLSSGWGGGSIMPWHAIDGIINLANLWGDPSNVPTSYSQMLPSTGPFRVTGYLAESYIKLERNPLYWGWSHGYGPHVNEIWLEWFDTAGPRFTALETNRVDFGEYPVASTTTYQGQMSNERVRVFLYNYPSSNGVWFNFDNPILSNRYVRQAIAHAIPYDPTISSILTSWGIETAYPGKSYIQPNMHYWTYGGTTINMFNEVLEPYEYSIDKASQYLDMWLKANSTRYPNQAVGPVGDADFSGRVDYDDFWVWWKNYGVAPGSWPWSPGNDIDPDFNNDNSVTMADYDLWSLNYNKEYPFAGAR